MPMTEIDQAIDRVERDLVGLKEMVSGLEQLRDRLNELDQSHLPMDVRNAIYHLQNTTGAYLSRMKRSIGGNEEMLDRYKHQKWMERTQRANP